MGEGPPGADAPPSPTEAGDREVAARAAAAKKTRVGDSGSVGAAGRGEGGGEAVPSTGGGDGASAGADAADPPDTGASAAAHGRASRTGVTTSDAAAAAAAALAAVCRGDGVDAARAHGGDGAFAPTVSTSSTYSSTWLK